MPVNSRICLSGGGLIKRRLISSFDSDGRGLLERWLNREGGLNRDGGLIERGA